MARTITMASNLKQVERLVVRPIEDLLIVKNDDFTTKSISEDMREDIIAITEFKKKIVPIVTIEETEDNVLPDSNLTYDDGVKEWNQDQISGQQTGILLEELFEIEENPHIDIKEKEGQQEIISDPADHAATAWNRELQTDELHVEQPHVEQPHSEQPHSEQPHAEIAEQPHADESRDLQAINSVAMAPSSMLQVQDDEFKTIEEMNEEEKRLMMEIEKRGGLQKTITERLARIKKMREFVKKLNDIGEIEAKEENKQMEKRLNEVIDDYLTAGEQSTSFSDTFTIVNDNGKSTFEASMVVTLKDKRLKKSWEKKTYRITYDITGSQINRSYYVFTDDDTTSLQTNEARKTTEASTSEVITQSKKRVRENLPTKSNSTIAMQLRKRVLRRKPAYEPKKRKRRDPMTITRNKMGRFVKTKN